MALTSSRMKFENLSGVLGSYVQSIGRRTSQDDVYQRGTWEEGGGDRWLVVKPTVLYFDIGVGTISFAERLHESIDELSKSMRDTSGQWSATMLNGCCPTLCLPLGAREARGSTYIV